MGHGTPYKGQIQALKQVHYKLNDRSIDDIVLEKGIFVTIFEKDIRRVFIYKKAERLAKAIHLIIPAFADSASLRERVEGIAVGLVDAAIRPAAAARAGLSRELLSLSSVLAIARTAGILSPMNADLISQEAHALLQEIADYEEPRLAFEDAPTLSDLARSASQHARETVRGTEAAVQKPESRRETAVVRKVESVIKDKPVTGGEKLKDRREGVLSVIMNKGRASIKDVSLVIRDVSEKTIQRELQALVEEGVIVKKGERRWSTYSPA